MLENPLVVGCNFKLRNMLLNIYLVCCRFFFTFFVIVIKWFLRNRFSKSSLRNEQSKKIKRKITRVKQSLILAGSKGIMSKRKLAWQKCLNITSLVCSFLCATLLVRISHLVVRGARAASYICEGCEGGWHENCLTLITSLVTWKRLNTCWGVSMSPISLWFLMQKLR